MKENFNDKDNPNDLLEQPDSPARRKMLKKAVYVAPTLVTLGVLTPIDSAFAWSVPPPPGMSPSQEEEWRRNFRNL